MYHPRLSLILLAFTFALLAACADRQEAEDAPASSPTPVETETPAATPEPSPTPMPTTTVTATAKPEPSPTATPESEDLDTDQDLAATPTIDTSNWTSVGGSLAGYEIGMPPGWVPYFIYDEGVTLASTEMLGAGGLMIPEGEMAVTLMSPTGLPVDFEMSVDVGAGGYPGEMYRDTGQHGALLSIRYQANGREWEVIAEFGHEIDEQLDDAEMFFAIVSTIKHDFPEEGEFPTADQIEYELIDIWEGFAMGPTGMDIDPEGNIYVVESQQVIDYERVGVTRILKYSPTGELLGEVNFGTRRMNTTDIAVIHDQGETLMVVTSDAISGDFIIYNAELTRLLSRPNCAVSFPDNHCDIEPAEGIAIDIPNLRIFTSQSGQIGSYLITGDYLGEHFRIGFNPTLHINHETRYLYIPDRSGGVVWKMSLDDPSHILELHGFEHPNGVFSAADGKLYVTEFSQGHVVVMDEQFGTVHAIVGEAGDAPGQFERPFDVVVNDEGVMYVSDLGNGRIQVFAPVR